jgi:tRNA (guanine37-N1)-methyltransferase
MRPTITNPTHRLAIAIISLFPDMFPGPLAHGLAEKSRADGIWSLQMINLRDFTTDKHKTVDDTPCGGGAGMVLKPDIADAAIAHAKNLPEFAKASVIYLTPRGQVFDYRLAQKLAVETSLIIFCGRYEGLDQRVIDKHAMQEISIGDYILSGGEVAAMAVLDAVIRLLPGTVGNAASIESESFHTGLLEPPLYTKPALWDGRAVPDVLLSGNHGKINQWRKQRALADTAMRRPDLLKKVTG